MYKLIAGRFYEHEKVTISDGEKTYTRVVRYRRDCGLYVLICNCMIFEYEVEL